MTRARILLADDHEIIIEGLRRILEAEFDLVGIAYDGLQLVQQAEQKHPDVIVADITMPLLNGIEAARQILATNPNARIVLLTMHPDVPYASQALDIGVTGYVLKTSAGSQLVTAIREALCGRVYVTASINARLVHERCGRPPERRNATEHLLTARQREVVRMVSEGNTTKEIAHLLRLSPRTVEFHKYRAMDVLGVKSSAELIQFALRNFA